MFWLRSQGFFQSTRPFDIELYLLQIFGDIAMENIVFTEITIWAVGITTSKHYIWLSTNWLICKGLNYVGNKIWGDSDWHTCLTVPPPWYTVRHTRLIPRYSIQKAFFVGYLAKFQFKPKKYPTDTKRLHLFLEAVAVLYPPPP